MKKILEILSLTKPRLSLLIALSGAFGFLLVRPAAITDASLIFLAILVLSLAGASLNNYQDRELDRQLPRTQNRALPAKRVHPNWALGLFFTFFVLGLLLLYWITNDGLSVALGIASIVLYNGIYTPLKPRTILAILPGAACGMMPPLIGWQAGGGALNSAALFSVLLIFFLWQLPHFWLILLKYKQQYQSAAIPNMLKIFSERQLKAISFVWILTFASTTLYIPYFNLVQSTLSKGFLVFNALALCLGFVAYFFRKRPLSPRVGFIHINIAMFFMMMTILIDRAIL
jgi:protoheme IX farnesyltransferase